MPVLTLADFEARCKPGVEKLERELSSWNHPEWEYIFMVGRPTIKLGDALGEVTLGIILPAGKDGWRVPLIQLKREEE